MENNRGISIIELIVVMIIMIMLVAFSVYSGINYVQKSEATNLYEEMHSMKIAIGNINMEKSMGDHDDTWLIANYTNEDVGNGWYKVIATEELAVGEKDLSNNYGLDTIRRTYLVNFKEEDLILENPVEVLGTSIRTYDSIRTLVESNKI